MCSGARGGVSFLSLEVCEQRRWVRSASVPPVAPRARRPLEPDTKGHPWGAPWRGGGPAAPVPRAGTAMAATSQVRTQGSGPGAHIEYIRLPS